MPEASSHGLCEPHAVSPPGDVQRPIPAPVSPAAMPTGNQVCPREGHAQVAGAGEPAAPSTCHKWAQGAPGSWADSKVPCWEAPGHRQFDCGRGYEAHVYPQPRMCLNILEFLPSHPPAPPKGPCCYPSGSSRGRSNRQRWQIATPTPPSPYVLNRGLE